MEVAGNELLATPGLIVDGVWRLKLVTGCQQLHSEVSSFWQAELIDLLCAVHVNDRVDLLLIFKQIANFCQ